MVVPESIFPSLIRFALSLLWLNILPARSDHTQAAQKTMETMKAVKFDEYGGPEKLYIGEAELPEPEEGEVLIKVYATAINRADTFQLAGSYNPPPGASPILGLEAAGEVVKLGPGCSKCARGDRVAALLGGGGNAEFAVAHEGHLMPLSSHMSMLDGAAIPEVWLTAYQLLHFVGHVRKGDKVLIHAAGSGVGTAAIQLVHFAGAEAIATAGTAAKLDMAKKLGAVAAFNYKEVDFADKVMEYTKNQGVNLILDCVGASYWEKNVRSIAIDGTWVVYGLLGGAAVQGPILGGLLRKRATLVGTTLRARSLEYKKDLVRAFTENILPHFGNTVRPIIDRVFPLDEIVNAHQHMAANKNTGKIVLKVREEQPVDSHSEL